MARRSQRRSRPGRRASKRGAEHWEAPRHPHGVRALGCGPWPWGNLWEDDGTHLNIPSGELT